MRTLNGWTLLTRKTDLLRWHKENHADSRPEPPAYPCLVQTSTAPDGWAEDRFLIATELQDLLALLSTAASPEPEPVDVPPFDLTPTPRELAEMHMLLAWQEASEHCDIIFGVTWLKE